MPTVQEYESALKASPSDTEAFVALRKVYREVQQHDKLVTLYETRAQAIADDTKAAELFYLAAEVRTEQLGDSAGAEADLVNAVHRDPGHIRAAARLKDIYREEGRTADYMVMLEMEAAAVARTRDPARISELQSEMGQLFVNHFARLERRVRDKKRPGQLTADDVKSIESARKIYRAIGDYAAVVRLYELELDGTVDVRRRADLFLGLGRVLGEKLGELDAAARCLSEVIRLRPRDEKALELLAAVYANPNWIGADGPERAATLYLHVARRRQEAGDVDNAEAALHKALQAVPGHPETSELLERLYFEGQRFEQLDRYYAERFSAAQSEPERIALLYQRAHLAEDHRQDRAAAQQFYAAIARQEPPAGKASQKLVELALAGHEYAKAAGLLEAQLAAPIDSTVRAQILFQLAALYRDALAKSDQAAVYLQAGLEIEPHNEVALKAHADHLRLNEDWEALGEVYRRTGRWQELSVLLRERLLPAASGARHLALLRELLPTYLDRLGDLAGARWACEEILARNPNDRDAMVQLEAILERLADHPRLAEILERHSHRTTSAQEDEQVTRRLADVLESHLDQRARAIGYWEHVLRLVPSDGQALQALERSYDQLGRPEDLARILEEKVKAPSESATRADTLRRLAKLASGQLGDPARAQRAWRDLLALRPWDYEAQSALSSPMTRDPIGTRRPSVGGGSAPSPHVFISHATADRPVVERDIITLLHRHGVRTWYSRTDIRTASEWDREIMDGLKACNWLLVAASPRAALSPWVRSEVRWAFEKRKIRVVSVLLEECDLADIHLLLTGIQYVDFRSPSQEQRARLLRTWEVDLSEAS